MRQKIRIIAAGALVLCLVVTAGLFLAAKRSGKVYQTVEVTVVSARQTYRRDGDARRAVSLVQVEYEGERYELLSPGGYQNYAAGETVTAYLSWGRMYADPAAITPVPALVIAYFAAMAASFVTAALFLIGLLPKRQSA